MVAIERPQCARRGVTDLVGEQFAGAKILEPHGVSLVTSCVDAVRQQIAVFAHRERTETEEVGALGLDVGVEEDLLPLHTLTGLNRRRRPVVGAGDRAPRPECVLLALFGTCVIPILTASRRHRHVGFLGAALDLAVDVRAEICEVGGVRGGVLVLLFEECDDLGILFVAQPLVVVDHGVSVVFALERDLFRDGRRACCCVLRGVGHCSPFGQSSNDRPEIRS